MKLWLTRQNITKFLLTTAAFYALLSFNVFHVGETIVPESKDYLNISQQAPVNIQTSGEQYIQDAMQEIQSGPNHGAAEDLSKVQTKFDAVCTLDTALCKEINFEGVFSIKEKFLYLSSIFKVTQFIDEYLITKQEVNKTLKTLSVNKDFGSRRGYATHDTIVLNLGPVENNQEFLELVSHEMGHILDLGMIEGTDTTQDTNYTEFGKAVFSINDISLLFYALSWDNETIRKATATNKDFCSGYGMSDPFEDLAECFNLYTHHNNLFKKFALSNKIMKKKYNFIAALFAGIYISKGEDTLSANTRPRDTTKIN